MIILPGCDAGNLMKIGNRIRERIAESPLRHQEQSIGVAVSMGGVVQGPRNTVEVQQLLHTADLALYRAKHNGRNRVELGTLAGHTPTPNETLENIVLV